MSTKREPFALVNVLLLSGVAAMLVSVWMLSDQAGWSYYSTPLRVRGYATQHAALKPSGSIAHPLGLVGIGMLSMPLVYALRKKWSRLRNAGSLATWLEMHIFCGFVGPVLVTFHTALKFNGVISVAYWSMVLVMLSGFVGRYWYVRIPKTIRGVELTRDEIEARVEALASHVSEAGASPRVFDRIASRRVGGRWARWRLQKALVRDGVAALEAGDLVQTLAERDVLLRRLVYLERTKRLFAAWHLFHQPLVYVMFGIAVLHVGLAVYFGYSFH